MKRKKKIVPIEIAEARKIRQHREWMEFIRLLVKQGVVR
jgi:hypothetical protein